MIALFLLAQVISTLPEPAEAAKPATSWECDFNDATGATFALSATFPEIPAGADPNGHYPVEIKGTGPTPLVGRRYFNGFDSYREVRFYQIMADGDDGSHYVTMLALQPGDKLGFAKVTRYVPAPNNQPGKLLSFASGSCRATFHPLGFKGQGQ